MKRVTENKMHCQIMAMVALLPPEGEMPPEERRKLRNERKRARRAGRR